MELTLATTTLDTELSERLVGDALGNTVAAFDGFGRETCRVHAASAAAPEKAEHISFQNLRGACDAMRKTFGFDLAGGVSSEEWEFASVCFQKRHLLAHKMGVVDGEYLEKTRDAQAVEGRKVCVRSEEISALVKVLRKLGAHFVKQFGEPATETIGEVELPMRPVASATQPAGPLAGVKMSLDAQRLAAFLSERAQFGIEIYDAIEVEAVLAGLKFSQEDFEIAADELEERGWVKLHLGGIRIAPTARFFFETDVKLRGWDPMSDAKNLAMTLAERGEDGSLQELDGKLGWVPGG